MKVNTDELQRQADEIRSIAGRINDIQDSVLRIARNLGREQFGERFRYPLNDAAAAVGRRSDELRRMRTALQQIARLYERTEVRITEEADHAAVHHEQSGIGAIFIPSIQGGAAIPPITTHHRNRTLGWVGVPVVPIGVNRIVQDYIERRRTRNRDRGLPDIPDMLDRMNEAFQEQYGPVWISEGSVRHRERMRQVLEEAGQRVADGITTDPDTVAEEIARIANEYIQESISPRQDRDIPPQILGFPDGALDAIQDVLYNDGESGYIPPHQIPSNDLPTIDPSVILDGIEGDIVVPLEPVGPSLIPDPIPDSALDAVRDALYNDGESGYVPPHQIPSNDLPTIDPSVILDGVEGEMIVSLDPVGPSLTPDPVINSIDADAGMHTIAEDVPTLGGDNSGQIGAIDWTPWNP